MNQFRVWIRLPYANSTFITMSASTVHECQQLAEMQYGVGNVISVVSA